MPSFEASCTTVNQFKLIGNTKPSSFEILNSRSWDSIVGIVTSYGPDDRRVRVRVPVGSRIFSSPRRPDWLWGPSNLLFNGHRELFPWG
jgi:hypothetical protein